MRQKSYTKGKVKGNAKGIVCCSVCREICIYVEIIGSGPRSFSVFYASTECLGGVNSSDHRKQRSTKICYHFL